MRKYVIGHLVIRSLDLTDIISLSIFLAIDIGMGWLVYFSYPEEYKFFYNSAVEILTLGLIISPFSMRFTSVSFSVGWLILSLIYIVEKNISLSYVPLLMFLLYHIARFAFWKKYDRELIPPELGKGSSMSTYSARERRWGGKEDEKYLKIMVWVGAFILATCLLLAGKRVQK
jgi:hypothetical protein